jgi:hypothetical protein
MLESILVVWARVGSMTTQGGDSIAKVRMGPQHRIHEGTEGALVEFGRDFRGLKFNKVLVGKGWSRDGIGVGHSIVVEDFFYEVFLRQGDGSLLTVMVHMNA